MLLIGLRALLLLPWGLSFHNKSRGCVHQSGSLHKSRFVNQFVGPHLEFSIWETFMRLIVTEGEVSPVLVSCEFPVSKVSTQL